MVDESVTVKGPPVRSLQRFIETELQPEQREIAFARLPPEYAIRFRSPIHLTEAVPVHMLNLFTEKAAAAKGEPIEEFARRAGRQAAGETVTGIRRVFALAMSPPALLRRASRSWSALYNAGELRIVERGPHSARIRLANFPSEATGCSRIGGWIERIAELTGAHRVRVRKSECIAAGAPCCEWLLEWES